MNILVVDADLARRHSIEDMIHDLGYDKEMVKGVGTTSDVFFSIQQRPCDAVFLFDSKTSFNCLDILKELRSVRGYDELPVIVLNESPTREAVLEAYQAGANGVVRYPCPPENIKKMLRLLETSPQKAVAK